ncbi:MAG TPA: DUF1501 domain-containing protein, partial [Pirellulaceae bacterium]
MNPLPFTDASFQQAIRRRTFLQGSGLGLGQLALATLWGDDAVSAERASSAQSSPVPHLPARAKRVIHLYMAGGPSHLESFDPKPELKKLHGQPFPDSFTRGQQLAQLQNTQLLAQGPFCNFRKHGVSGQEVSEIFPHLAHIADDLCIIRSMQTEQINHDPAHAFMNSGSIIKGRPSYGSWLLYGLGAETDELPGFVVLSSVGGSGGAQPISARQWSAGFLPSRYQGIKFHARGDAVHYLGNPAGVCQSLQRQVIDEIQHLNGLAARERMDPEIETRMAQYELAFRMQTSVPELADLSREPESILELYGVEHPGDGSFASNCLMARRLAERGVRCIQLYHRGWDHHGDIAQAMPLAAREVDRASAALVSDLKQRGML